MLGVSEKNALDSVNKSLGFAQTLTKKGLEFFPGNADVGLVLYFMLVLLPVEQDGIFQENVCKYNSVWPYATSGGKVIFALLEETIAFHIDLT